MWIRCFGIVFLFCIALACSQEPGMAGEEGSPAEVTSDASTSEAQPSESTASNDSPPLDDSEPRHFPWNMAHRGGKNLYPQNTLVAFELSVKEHNVDVLELDIFKTKDDVVVVQHDLEMNKTTDCSTNVTEINFDEHQKCNVVHKFRPDKDVTNKFVGSFHPHASLEQMFQKFPNHLINIEIKQHTPSLVPQLVALIRKYKRAKTVIVVSAGDIPLKEFRKLAPEITTGMSFEEAFYFLSILGEKAEYKAFVPKGVALQIPASNVTEQVVRAAHAKGLEVHPWTVNDTATMRKLLAMGVDGIITDRPDRLAALLKERKEASSP